MQLTKLEAKGFKSFGDKITIHFGEGVTGIVGPNGCGKSNVVDAIRWVLGEQSSKALRSDKMENVIFNGTKNRKPLQMAEVSLTFENTRNILPTEYSSITISRRYYRSGDSEYLLNGVACRLKDITNLFLDTGIGPESYAIIELKMVDDILNDRDNSRRTLFEEAAGVSKFKIRKKETLRKLDDTQKDLDRLEDVIFEIEKNLKTLEKQAKQAEAYFGVKEKYKEASLEFAKQSLYEQQAETRKLKAQTEQFQQGKSEVIALQAKQEAEIQALKNQTLNAEKLVGSRQKTLNDFVANIRQKENERNVRKERLAFFTERSSKLSDQVFKDKQALVFLAQEIAKLSDAVSGDETGLKEVEAELQVLTESLETKKQTAGKFGEEVTMLLQQQRQNQEALYNQEKALEMTQLQLSGLKQEVVRNETDANLQSGSLGEFHKKGEEISKSIEQANEELLKLQAEEIAMAQQGEDLLIQTEQLKAELNELNRQLDARQNEYNLTKSLVDNLEGYPEAIKFLKKNKNWSKTAPLVTDIITCEDKYKVAIEGFLEPVLNHYVVQTEIEAFQAMRMLSESQKGRANFFVLDKLKGGKSSQAKKYDDALRALDVVECDERYQTLVNHLLSDVYITDRMIPFMHHNFQDGLTLFDDVKWDWPDGIFISVNGNLTQRKFGLNGGSVGMFEGNRIGKARQLEKLSQTIARFTEQATEKKQRLQELDAAFRTLKQQSKKQDIEQTNKRINQWLQEQAAVKTRLEQTQSFLHNSQVRREDMLNRVQELEQDIARQMPLLAETKAQFESLRDQLSKANELSAKENETLSATSAEYNAVNIRFFQKQNQLKSNQQQLEFKSQEELSVKQRLEGTEAELSQVQSEIEKLQNTEVLNDDALKELYAEKATIESGLNDAEREYYGVRGKIDELEKDLKDLQRKRENLDVLINECQQKATELRVSLTSVIERISVEFEVHLDESDLEGYAGSDKTIEQLQDKVRQVKNQLERMGPINPMAMEAFNEMKQRLDFIAEQKKDLLDARKSLESTISDIEAVAKQNFMEAFNQIRENFKTVFRSLFTEEDTCDLVLTQPDNPLESPIDITAKPKGKRPLTINQLSGGEKTLTATSLLFAIYLIKPAPFCIFDEVDAPLDDANIDKFNNIIRTFSKDSQFIIVTHNKRTMSSTDVIYGITMPEQGVSKVIPVDLRELA